MHLSWEFDASRGVENMTPKKVVQQLLETLPDTCTYEDIQRHVELFQNLHHNQEAVMFGAAARLEVECFVAH